MDSGTFAALNKEFPEARLRFRQHDVGACPYRIAKDTRASHRLLARPQALPVAIQWPVVRSRPPLGQPAMLPETERRQQGFRRLALGQGYSRSQG